MFGEKYFFGKPQEIDLDGPYGSKDLKFPIGYGVDKDTSDNLGGYWETRRNFAQPSEFLITPSGKMAQVSYSDGPLARTEAGDVIKLVGFLESQKKK